MKKTYVLFYIFLLFFYSADAQTKTGASSNLDSIFRPVKWRSIGPFRGGRSVAACGVIGDPNTYYMGTTGGGLWKTDDMGMSWKNISDGFFKTGSVGAVAVAPSDPNVVYTGMGEHAVRGVMTHHGDGVYKSTDAGKTWHHVGLQNSQHISRIIIDPVNPDIVYVAVQGALYSKSAERGLYKTADGGKNWKKILYINDQTGCAELSMDRNNTRVLYAAMWEHGRLPWKVISGGPGSGLYKSTDYGETWQKLESGLPKEMGKMSIAVSPANSEKVYALIESDFEKEAGGLYVSANAGKTWKQVSKDHRLIQRAWYYIECFPDPVNENTLYVLSAPALRSEDGGNTWEILSGTHGDFHDLWINPDNPRNMVIANDGGAAISLNYGKTWSTQSNMPTAQIYRISVDNQFPYRIYGGQQDNTSLSIAHREFGSSGITTNSWRASAGGESAFLAFDPHNPDFVLGGSYMGTIEVLNTKANAGTNIMTAPIQYLAMDAKDMKYRYNWNAPIIRSLHEPNTFYHAAQVLLKTTDWGKHWNEVSPDLTRNEKEKQGKGGGPFTNEAVGAENYGTISYVAESPHEKGVIWTGSDDGLVHVTRDGGSTWQNVTPKGLTECLVNAIEISPHDKATVYIATTRYKFNDHTPAIYKTTDYGKTWVNISSGIPSGAFTRVVREDDQRKDLLFAGTETGVFISWDGGRSWQPFQLNLPVTPVTDLKIHKGDLIASTSGRSFWILDDMGLIRQYKKDQPAFSIYQPEETYLVNGSSELNGSSEKFNGSHPFRGVNPANGIVVYYTLPELADSVQISMEILDASGKQIRRFSSMTNEDFKSYDGGPQAEPVLSKSKGLNRFVWDMRHATMPGIPDVYIESSYAGHKASPGKYEIRIRLHGESRSAAAVILPNPLYPVTEDEYAGYDKLMTEMESSVALMHQMVNRIYAKSRQLAEAASEIPSGEKYNSLKMEADKLLRIMKAWDEEMIQRKSTAYDDVENFPNKFTANYMFLINQTESDIPKVNQPSLDRKKELDAVWGRLRKTGDEILNKHLPAINQLFWDAGIGAIWKN